MHQGTQAYRAVAKEIASPRELEASLLLKAAARLQAVVDSWDRNRSDLDGALLYNRKLWTVFLGSAMSDDNPLPVEMRQTVAVTANPQVEVVNSLVTINRELAAGLRGQG